MKGNQKSKRYLQKEKTLLKDLSLNEVELITSIKEKNLTYLSKFKLAGIVLAIKSINQQGLKGMFIEAGCALGGSSILISKLKKTDISFNVFDVFEMIPPPSEHDTEDVHDRYKVIAEGKSKGIGDDLYYGYQEDLYSKVIKNFVDFDINLEHENIKLIKGLVQETMNINEPVAFGHIDVDWYEPVKTCLEQIWPNLIIGGSIILDDYKDWGGCKKATDEYFENFNGEFSKDDQFGSLRITKL